MTTIRVHEIWSREKEESKKNMHDCWLSVYVVQCCAYRYPVINPEYKNIGENWRIRNRGGSCKYNIEECTKAHVTKVQLKSGSSSRVCDVYRKTHIP